MQNNKELWDKWCNTPLELVKEKKQDGLIAKTTASINRIEKATEVLGLYGKDWGLKNIEHSKYQMGNLLLAEISAIFFIETTKYKTNFEIHNSTSVTNRVDGKITFNAQYLKSLETDTICKALSRVGLFADLYKHDDDEVIDEIDIEYIKQDDIISSKQ